MMKDKSPRVVVTPSVSSTSVSPFLNHCSFVTWLTSGDSATHVIVTMALTVTVWEVGGVSIPIAGEETWVREIFKLGEI